MTRHDTDKERRRLLVEEEGIEISTIIREGEKNEEVLFSRMGV